MSGERRGGCLHLAALAATLGAGSAIIAAMWLILR